MSSNNSSKTALERLKDSGVAGVKVSRGALVGRYTPPKKQGTDRRAELPNNQGKRADDLAALSYFQYDVLDRSQAYATPGDTLPVVFCERMDDQGGVWVSPPLLETVSVDFEHTFVYVISEGNVEQQIKSQDLFIGKDNFASIAGDLGNLFDAQLYYAGHQGACPFGGGASGDIDCSGTVYKGALDMMPAGSIDGNATYRVVGEYASSITFKAKPLPVNEDRFQQEFNFPLYTIDVLRLPIQGFGADGNPPSLVGQIELQSDGTIGQITDSSVGDTYAYYFNLFNVDASLASTRAEGILLEVSQQNTFTDPPNRAAMYRNMTLLAVKGNLYNPKLPYSDPKDLKQLHFYCTGGKSVWKYRPGRGRELGPSNRFSDLVAMFIEESAGFVGESIDTTSCQQMAQFHYRYKMFFNGVISSTTNFLNYVQEVSPFFLCALHLNGGVYQFVPVVPLNSDNSIRTNGLAPVERFDDSETEIDRIGDAIIAESYERTYIDSISRRPFTAAVSYRDINDHGMEVFKTVTVRYADYASTAPEEAYDLSEFATNKEHAVIFAKYILATRRYSDHMVSFSTPRNFALSTNLKTYDLIEVSVNRVNSEGDSQTETDHYLVTDIEVGGNGISTLRGEHFPLVGSSSVISSSIVSGNFIIDQ